MSDVVDLTSYPEGIGADGAGRGRKRGRDKDEEEAVGDNGTVASATSSSGYQSSKRRIVDLVGSGARTTGEEGAEGVICLLDSIDDSSDEEGPSKPSRNANSSSNAVDRTSPLQTATTTTSGAWEYPKEQAVAAIPSTLATSASAYNDSVKGNLCHEKKREHFDDARRPEQLLRQEIFHLRGQLRSISNRQSEKYKICQNQIDELETQLQKTRKNAAEDIYNRNNSAGTMGQVDGDGQLTVDYHGLYVKDATEKYDSMVLPVLPVQRNIAIITGKGRHSVNGRSALRDGLLDHVRQSTEYQEKKIHCQIDPKNEGKLLVKWIGGEI